MKPSIRSGRLSVRLVLRGLSAALLIGAGASQLRAEDSKPDTGGELIKPLGPTSHPTTKPTDPSTKPSAATDGKKGPAISADAKEVLDKVGPAYKAIKTLKLAGTVAGDLDLNSEHQTNRAHFTASLASPQLFRHELMEQVKPGSADSEMKPSMTVGGTGKKLYIYEPQYKYFYMADAPKERTGEALGKSINGLLSQQDPSLLLAIVDDAVKELVGGTDKVEKIADTKIGDDSCPTLKMTAGKTLTVTMAFDPKTSLIRRMTQDFRGLAEARKQQDIKSALVTLDYTKTETDGEVKAETFAWAPPEGARDVTTMADAAGPGEEEDAPDAAHAKLIGQPAPDFSLKGLDGKEVKLSELKGSVVLLDFWATWCGPCRASLPHLDEIYQSLKDKGLKAYAIDLREAGPEVKSFVESTKLGIPVLLDVDGKVAEKFGVGGIPQTVVIDRNGKIVKIFVGSGSHEAVRQAIEGALK